MRDARFAGGACGCLNRDEIDAAELRGFRRARMRRADQVHQRRTGRDRRGERRVVERVPHDGYGARRKFRFASGPCQRVHSHAAFQQLRDQRPAQVAGSAGDENWRQIELTLRLKSCKTPLSLLDRQPKPCYHQRPAPPRFGANCC